MRKDEAAGPGHLRRRHAEVLVLHRLDAVAAAAHQGIELRTRQIFAKLDPVPIVRGEPCASAGCSRGRRLIPRSATARPGIACARDRRTIDIAISIRFDPVKAADAEERCCCVAPRARPRPDRPPADRARCTASHAWEASQCVGGPLRVGERQVAARRRPRHADQPIAERKVRGARSVQAWSAPAGAPRESARTGSRAAQTRRSCRPSPSGRIDPPIGRA